MQDVDLVLYPSVIDKRSTFRDAQSFGMTVIARTRSIIATGGIDSVISTHRQLGKVGRHKSEGATRMEVSLRGTRQSLEVQQGTPKGD